MTVQRASYDPQELQDLPKNSKHPEHPDDAHGRTFRTRWVLKDAGRWSCRHLARRLSTPKGRIVKGGGRKAIRDRQLALTDLVHAIREYRKLAGSKPLRVAGERLPGYKRGLVKRLLAPSFSATTDITIGGQTFEGSQDGKAVGTGYGEFTRSQNGTFEVSVGPTSAFLLTLKKREYDRDED